MFSTHKNMITIREIRYNKGGIEQLIQHTENGAVISEEWTPVPSRWDAIDWTKTNVQIAADTWETQHTVRRIRKSRGLPNWDPAAHCGVDWTKIDWSKTNSQLSRELGQDQQLINRVRARMGMPQATKLQTRALVDKIDWTLRDIDIAREVGMCRERIRQLRNMYKKPQSPRYKRSIGQVRIQEYIEANREKLTGRTYREICDEVAKSVNCAPQTVRKEIAKYPYLNPTRGLHPNEKYRRVNFELPNKALALIWGCSQQTMATKRMLSNAERSRWSMMRNNTTDILDPEFKKAVDAEIEKANALGFGIDPNTIHATICERLVPA